VAEHQDVTPDQSQNMYEHRDRKLFDDVVSGNEAAAAFNNYVGNIGPQDDANSNEGQEITYWGIECSAENQSDCAYHHRHADGEPEWP